MISNNDAIVNFTATRPGHRITGTLTDENGFPIEGVEVHASANINGGFRSATPAITGIDGSFSLRVINGTWRVDVSFGLSALPYLRPFAKEVEILDADAVVDFVTVGTTQLITGSLRDCNGNPLVGVSVVRQGTTRHR